MRHARSIESLRRAINAALLLVVALGAACARPAAALETSVAGARVRASGWLETLGTVDTGGGPHEHPWGRARLDADADVTRRLSLVVQLRGHVGGPFRGASAGVYDFGETYQNDSPALELGEAYAAWRLPEADVRAGLQLFAWGKLDGVPPTDVLNPRDYHDPIVDDAEERKIGVPALSATYYAPVSMDAALSRLEVQLVYVPIAVPPRLALERERWFPETTRPPSRFTRADLAAYGFVLDGGVPVAFATRNDVPPRTLEAGGIGLRIGGTLGSVDWNLYQYSGPETNPDARLQATVVPDSGPSGLAARAALVQEHDVIHMFGLDAAFVVGPVAVRAEGAYFLDRPYLRRGADVLNEALLDVDQAALIRSLARNGRARIPFPPLFADRDAVEWGIGADGLWWGVRPLVQLSQIVLTEDAPRLLIGQPETRLTASLRRSVLGDRIELELRSIYCIETSGWFAFPRIAYVPRDDLRLRLGYLAVGGSRYSMIGQFHHDDEVVLDARWTF